MAHVAGNTISNKLQFVKINVSTNLVTTQAARDLIMQVAAQTAQPLIVGNAFADVSGYSLRFASISLAWAAADLKAALIAAGSGTYSWATGNVTVTITDTMDA